MVKNLLRGGGKNRPASSCGDGDAESLGGVTAVQPIPANVGGEPMPFVSPMKTPSNADADADADASGAGAAGAAGGAGGAGKKRRGRSPLRIGRGKEGEKGGGGGKSGGGLGLRLRLGGGGGSGGGGKGPRRGRSRSRDRHKTKEPLKTLDGNENASRSLPDKANEKYNGSSSSKITAANANIAHASTMAATSAAAAPCTPNRAVKFADESSVDRPLSTTKIIPKPSPAPSVDGSTDTSTGTGNDEGSDGSKSNAAAPPSPKPAPGEAFVGTPPRDAVEADRYWSRVLIMLLSPKTQQFEVVAIYHESGTRTSLSSVLRMIPRAATSRRFVGRRYRGLTRPGGKAAAAGSDADEAEVGVEMINALSLRDYNVQHDEILVAIPKGMTGRQVAPMASALLSDDRVMKLVDKIKKAKPMNAGGAKSSSGIGSSLRRLKRRAKKALRKVPRAVKIVCLLVLLAALHYVLGMPLLRVCPDEVQEAMASRWSQLKTYAPDSLQQLGIFGASVETNEAHGIRAGADELVVWTREAVGAHPYPIFGVVFGVVCVGLTMRRAVRYKENSKN